ncbi:unnamed protein product [Anisakis simplex]|uniref:TIL domain-containing protein n=1 Tax=Anisakis simplex TaxID=6269 RepID=A0A0M3J178_ANISI|nr:unnamed protein product [Anisakis simplex]
MSISILIYRHVPQFPHRIIRSRMDCRAHERYVRCGPEQHCDMSCANLFSPPHCFNPHQNHPKCFHPRCVCVSGYVRDKNGFCIRQWKCSGRFE